MGQLIMTPRNSALPLAAVVRVSQPADRRIAARRIRRTDLDVPQ
jgi:hypothetical protein